MEKAQKYQNSQAVDKKINLFPEKYRDYLKNSIKPYIEIKASRDSKVDFWQSKLGGKPYLLKKEDYPKNRDGEHLQFLAQINFAEVPHLEPYPEEGLLQFWIGKDYLYGLDFDNQTNQNSFRVIYYPKLQKEHFITDFDFVPKDNEEYSIFEDDGIECSLKFTQKIMPVTLDDFQCAQFFPDEFIDNYELCEKYHDTFESNGHRIGGYAHFTQHDPRSNEKMNVMLLQIDYDIDAGIMWGDLGVSNFFISEKDLKKKNFTNVLYNWDCF